MVSTTDEYKYVKAYIEANENNQDNSNTNESFNTLKPDKINKSPLSNHKREREPSKVFEEERKKSDKLYEKLETLKNISEKVKILLI